jgi:phospholipase/carboxylesterase
MTELHQSIAPVTLGTRETAQKAVIMLHGRGSSPEDILNLTTHFVSPDTLFIAPRAKNNTWYPQRFIRPNQENEPWLTSALEMVNTCIESTRLPLEKIVLLGFSQGACLVLEFAARHGGRFGGIIALSGGLIGSETEIGKLGKPLLETPIFIGCDEADFHIDLARVQVSTRILSSLGATVDTRIYKGLGHSINADEIKAAQGILKNVSL